MISNIEFIRQSLELNLFFMRIAKEHSIFLEAAFTPMDYNLAAQADALKREFEALLSQTIALSDGIISCEVNSSGEIVTNNTLSAETTTQYLSGIPINKNLTIAELSLGCGTYPCNISMLTSQVFDLNQRAIVSTTRLARFKENLLQNVLSCRIFTSNYPLLIDHILREARFYLNMLMKLQNRASVDITKDIIEQEIFWNRIMAEHSKFIRSLLDPTEDELINTANNFAKEFDELTAQAILLNEQIGLLPIVTRESLESTIDVRNFKKTGTDGLINCKIKSIAYPLLGDHVVREANHYIRLLKSYSSIVK